MEKLREQGEHGEQGELENRRSMEERKKRGEQGEHGEQGELENMKITEKRKKLREQREHGERENMGKRCALRNGITQHNYTDLLRSCVVYRFFSFCPSSWRGQRVIYFSA